MKVYKLLKQTFIHSYSFFQFTHVAKSWGFLSGNQNSTGQCCGLSFQNQSRVAVQREKPSVPLLFFFLVRIPSSLDKATTTPSLSPPRQLFHFASKLEGRQLFVCLFLVNLVNWNLPNCISQNTSQLDSKCDKFLPIPKADTVMPKLLQWLKDSLHSGQMFTCKSVKAPLTDAAPLWTSEKSHWPQD